MLLPGRFHHYTPHLTPAHGPPVRGWVAMPGPASTLPWGAGIVLPYTLCRLGGGDPRPLVDLLSHHSHVLGLMCLALPPSLKWRITGW